MTDPKTTGPLTQVEFPRDRALIETKYTPFSYDQMLSIGIKFNYLKVSPGAFNLSGIFYIGRDQENFSQVYILNMSFLHAY